jgi:hypothetical protein
MRTDCTEVRTKSAFRTLIFTALRSQGLAQKRQNVKPIPQHKNTVLLRMISACIPAKKGTASTIAKEFA